jgi:hypothetical protein
MHYHIKKIKTNNFDKTLFFTGTEPLAGAWKLKNIKK